MMVSSRADSWAWSRMEKHWTPGSRFPRLVSVRLFRRVLDRLQVLGQWGYEEQGKTIGRYGTSVRLDADHVRRNTDNGSGRFPPPIEDRKEAEPRRDRHAVTRPTCEGVGKWPTRVKVNYLARKEARAAGKTKPSIDVLCRQADYDENLSGHEGFLDATLR
ncbi:hypothetical protein LX36DRAFT_696653 [Colletotrichum falcatum]|nr:hypothetical protein LX36DRAFT_696653 [Colletotrichum falcatum]